MPDLYLLFNHTLTETQTELARRNLGVDRIIAPPSDVLRIWNQVPPEPASIRLILEPVFTWIDSAIKPGDYLLIQGDFGACHLALGHIAESGIIPVYATTGREAREKHLDNDTVELTHTFQHVRFRVYGR